LRGELIEHLLLDPMHLLFECHRILAEGGYLLLTTPNSASLHSVVCALHGRRNPQVFSAYPAPGNPDIPHVREYTAIELRHAVTAAGFDNSRWVQDLLIRESFNTSRRGEQTYCFGRRRAHLRRDRYPDWLFVR
ncbi:methyltransferase domain-containing protein, partial [Deinococcus sp.]|uniref:methyltransferase domain-containing protein n=1 Tax=Deinococcus sp. TaxID=47478 RepID=UPI00286E8D1F